MATFLDIGLLESFERVFTFLFVFVVAYALLSKINFPTDNKGLQAFIGFILAVFTALSGNVAKLIATMSPWFIIMFLLIAFILIGNMMFGMDEKYLKNYIETTSTVTTWIIIASALIVLISFSTVYGDVLLEFTQNTTSSSTTDVGHNIGAAIFHPKTLGLVFTLLIGVFAILLLAKTERK